MVETVEQNRAESGREAEHRWAYRSRIYSSYVTAHSELTWHDSVVALQRRGHNLRAMIRKHFPFDRAATIVDLGCGHGAIIHFAREFGYTNIVGIDRSPEQVELAARLGIEGVVNGDLMAWLERAPDQSYDLVVAHDIVEHFTKSEFLVFADQINRILKKGGRWLIHTCNGDSPFFGSTTYNDFTHEITFNTRSAKQVLHAIGFSRVDSFEDVPVIHGLVSFVRHLLWRLLVIGYRLIWAIEKGELAPDAVFSRDFLVVAEK